MHGEWFFRMDRGCSKRLRSNRAQTLRVSYSHTLLDFERKFEVQCDASEVGIITLFVQAQKPSARLIEKLTDSKYNYSNFDKEFYANPRALDHCSQYLTPKQFLLRSDRKALDFISGQRKLNSRHAEWVEFLQSFSFVSKSKHYGLCSPFSALGFLVPIDEGIIFWRHISLTIVSKEFKVPILYRMGFLSKEIDHVC